MRCWPPTVDGDREGGAGPAREGIAFWHPLDSPCRRRGRRLFDNSSSWPRVNLGARRPCGAKATTVQPLGTEAGAKRERLNSPELDTSHLAFPHI